MKLTYSRILLKMSGEQLGGASGRGFDPQVAATFAQEVAQAVAIGVEVVVVVGGGNFVRGVYFKDSGIQPVTADYMGMLSTVMNAIAVGDIFASQSVPAAVLSTVEINQAVDLFTQRRALHHLNKGRVVIVGGGIGRPYVTTDMVSVNLALELDCEIVCKLSKVDGVYDKDPMVHENAKRFDKLTFHQALENPEIKVMDKAAIGLAMEHKKPIVVCDLHHQDNIKKLALGETVGTLIS
jgi:uridylate kinase